MENKKIQKNKIDNKEYAEIAIWCNNNNYHIEDKGQYYEVIKNKIIDKNNLQIKLYEKEIDKLNNSQIRDIAIINTSEDESKINEAKTFLQIKQENKNKLIEKINILRGN